jgi:ABC-type transport system involved in cytochrome c biogenesis ATPase subunit
MNTVDGSRRAAAPEIGRRRVREVIDQVGLTDVAGTRAGAFPLGMGQRLGIASALLADPATILLDEPVNGLDSEGVLWIRTLLKCLAAEGRTVFVSSHLMMRWPSPQTISRCAAATTTARCWSTWPTGTDRLMCSWAGKPATSPTGCALIPACR